MEIDGAERSLKGSEKYSNYHHFLVHVSNICKLILPNTSKTQYDTNETVEIRKRRKKALKEYFCNYKDMDINILKNNPRDHLEHFDERLDGLVLLKEQGKEISIIDKNCFENSGPNPIPISKEMRKQQFYTRQLIIDNDSNTEIYQFYDQDYNISAMRKILKKLKEYIII
ncbi:MAG TPA: hypothetical protein VK153_02820 [Candidatus Paceibacterota bacterium]|nr:hypothetical protein [Candidatus Paceibacterota bacterium]